MNFCSADSSRVRQALGPYWTYRANSLELIQPFASKHKPQTFSLVCLRLKRRVCNFKRRVGRWKCECYRSANAAARGVTVMFDMENYILHDTGNNVVQRITKVYNFLR